jgi:hypothetical protein
MPNHYKTNFAGHVLSIDVFENVKNNLKIVIIVHNRKIVTNEAIIFEFP